MGIFMDVSVIDMLTLIFLLVHLVTNLRAFDNIFLNTMAILCLSAYNVE
jgi:hypothetical protein